MFKVSPWRSIRCSKTIPILVYHESQLGGLYLSLQVRLCFHYVGSEYFVELACQ